MKKQSQDQTNEQLHIDDAAAAQEEYSLEDIMNEFGGWSKKAGAGKSRRKRRLTRKSRRRKRRKAESRRPRSSVSRRASPSAPRESPKSRRTRRISRARPSASRPSERIPRRKRSRRSGRIRRSPDPEPVPDDPKEAKKAAQRARRAEKEAKKRQKQLERHQKQQAKRMERRKEQPEREFPDCRAAYTYYAQGTFQRLRLFLSILLAIVSGALAYFASYSLGSYDFTANADVFSKVLLIIMVVQAFIAFDVMLRGVRAVMKLRYDHASMLVVLTLACAVDAVLAIRAGRIPFCPAVTLAAQHGAAWRVFHAAGESTHAQGRVLR